jgi:hypothetical protein
VVTCFLVLEDKYPSFCSLRSGSRYVVGGIRLRWNKNSLQCGVEEPAFTVPFGFIDLPRGYWVLRKSWRWGDRIVSFGITGQNEIKSFICMSLNSAYNECIGIYTRPCVLQQFYNRCEMSWGVSQVH